MLVNLYSRESFWAPANISEHSDTEAVTIRNQQKTTKNISSD